MEKISKLTSGNIHRENIVTLSNESCKSMDTLIASGETLKFEMSSKTEKEKKDMFRVSYSTATKNLMFTMMCIYPNNYYVVGLVNRY